MRVTVLIEHRSRKAMQHKCQGNPCYYQNNMTGNGSELVTPKKFIQGDWIRNASTRVTLDVVSNVLSAHLNHKTLKCVFIFQWLVALKLSYIILLRVHISFYSFTSQQLTPSIHTERKIMGSVGILGQCRMHLWAQGFILFKEVFYNTRQATGRSDAKSGVGQCRLVVLSNWKSCFCSNEASWTTSVWFQRWQPDPRPKFSKHSIRATVVEWLNPEAHESMQVLPRWWGSLANDFNPR